ncbi:MAG: 16S rRNA (cytosine(1402)-N(4))-methyltransferase RsmH, partial [Bacteroidetes bacterium]|nr:16S rRNA (cytosine(1402)-N(4))-methyltransferase RsmH [Bacteroidota bacterium]
IDGTTGGGGFSEEICKQTSDESRIICIDKDKNALSYCKHSLEKYSDKITFVNDNFGDIKRILKTLNIKTITGFVLDLGLSSYQLEREDGFSYMKDTPLDMRASKNDKIKASDVVNGYSKQELTVLFRDYGEIGNAMRLSDIIIQNRKKQKINSTMQLVEIIKREYKISERNLYKFLSKIFQAIRITVNNELKNLENALYQSLDCLTIGGRLVVISYHSLEDRIVKNFFKEMSFIPSRSKYKSNEDLKNAKLKVLTKKPVIPSRKEIVSNSRARSAKLRAAERL